MPNLSACCGGVTPSEICTFYVTCWSSEGVPHENILVRVDGESSGQPVTWRKYTNSTGVATFELQCLQTYEVRVGQYTRTVELVQHAQTTEFMTGGFYVENYYWVVILVLIVVAIAMIFYSQYKKIKGDVKWINLQK